MGLTLESQSGTTGGPSHIIQPLARFTGDKTRGYMHFVPPQWTYLTEAASLSSPAPSMKRREDLYERILTRILPFLYLTWVDADGIQRR